MRKFKRFLTSLTAALLVVGSLTTAHVKAEGETSFTLNAEVTDAGQNIVEVVIDYKSFKPTAVDTGTYTVKATGKSERPEGVNSYGDFTDAERTIVSAKVDGTKVTLRLLMGETGAGTLAYLDAGRNVPLQLSYSVTQNVDIEGTEMDGTAFTLAATDTTYAWDKVVNDDETAKFESVLVDGGINYQFYQPEDTTGGHPLVVWFHGNGEGDYNSSNNNIAQMLANRGTVAWATDEAQEIFDEPYVMAFQAPDTWYYAQTKGYLEMAYNEIAEVVTKYNIDINRLYVSGCSAGGYMTTRMLIAYPNLFAAAAINCPALDVADARGGETPTDAELESIKESDTKIWLVQGETDSVVKPEDCSMRMFGILTEGEEVTKTAPIVKENASDFTTEETKDGKYKISLFETVNVVTDATTGRKSGKLEFAEDYNNDGVLETVQQSDHWSWIYTLLNIPQDGSGTHIWNWMAKQSLDTLTYKGDQTIVVEGFDWGPGVTKTIIKLEDKIDGINPEQVTVTETKTATMVGIVSVLRTVTAAYLSDADGDKVDGSSQYVTVEMAVNPKEGSPFVFSLETFSNSWTEPYDLTVDLKFGETVTNGDKVIGKFDITKTPNGKVMPEASLFDEDYYKAESGTTYSYATYTPSEDDGKNPLVIWLHGAGEGGSDTTITTLGNEVTALVRDEFQDIMKGAYILAPQCPTMWMDDGTGQYTQDGTSMYTEDLMALIEEYVNNNPDIDTNRIYIGGCSNGGFMTMNMVMKYPDYFAAAFPLCEAYTDEWITDEMLEGIVDLPMWFIYAKNDTTVNPTTNEEPTLARLTEMGSKYHVSVYENVESEYEGTMYEHNGHWSWIYFFNNDAKLEDGTTIFEWLAQQVKKEDTPVVTPTPTPTDKNQSANTGDNGLGLAAGSLLVAGALVTVLLRKRKELN